MEMTGRFLLQYENASEEWEFRLELGSILLHWTLPEGPSLEPGEPRLSIRARDRPVDKTDFPLSLPDGHGEGKPSGLWDLGQWFTADDPYGQLSRGYLRFMLHGARLRGEWVLARMAGRQLGGENWLLRKMRDSHAPSAGAQALPKDRPSLARALPRFQKPQLAMLTETVPSGDAWLHEIKYDGYRCLLAIAGDDVRVFSRSGQDWTIRFPQIVAAARELTPESAIIDGEIVAFNSTGRPDFASLQQALYRRDAPLTFMAFDLLELDGISMRARPLLERKQYLADLLDDPTTILRYTDHVIGGGEALLEAICAQCRAGIVSKRIDAPYTGYRDGSWRKVKCARRGNFFIIGWAPTISPLRSFASLALGQMDAHGNLHYRGRVGTGFRPDETADILRLLEALPESPPPHRITGPPPRLNRWVKPRLIAEVAYTGMTPNGFIRHARFIRLRDDRPPLRATAEIALKEDRPSTHRQSDHAGYEKARITRSDVTHYYERVAPLMVSSLGRRPISLARCPNGVETECFFHQYRNGGLHECIRHVHIPNANGKIRSYPAIESGAGVLACLQAGILEFHGWSCRSDRHDHTDRLVFDLDPGPGCAFASVREAARLLRDRLGQHGLQSRPMLSGSRGIHVIVPLDPPADWKTARRLARKLAERLTEEWPNYFTTQLSRARREQRIFIDWFRNRKGATSVEPYSLRARDSAPVAAPIDWAELDDMECADHFTIRDMDILGERASTLKDWQPVLQTLK